MKNIPDQKSKLETILKPMERGQITIPKAIREAAGITSDTWLWVRYLPSGKIEVTKAEQDEKPNSLVSALLKLKKLDKPIWTDEDTEHLKAIDEASKEKMRKLQEIW